MVLQGDPAIILPAAKQSIPPSVTVMVSMYMSLSSLSSALVGVTRTWRTAEPGCSTMATLKSPMYGKYTVECGRSVGGVWAECGWSVGGVWVVYVRWVKDHMGDA